MGYSIATPIKSNKLRDEMYSFLEENYREAHKVIGGDFSLSHLARDGEFSYDDGKCRIGFNYSPSDEHDYIYSICRWMALRVGKKRRLKKVNPDVSINYIVYDGNESWGVIQEGTMEVNDKCKWMIADKFGWKTPKQWTRGYLAQFGQLLLDTLSSKQKMADLIQEELKRLDGLWNNRNK